MKSVANCVLVIGNFDGVHRGHQMLLRKGISKAREMGLPCRLLTFDPHPHAFFHGGEEQRLFTAQDTSVQALSWGCSEVHVEKFNEAFANQTAEEFLQNFLIGKLQVKAVVVGFDFRFGSKRSGDVSTLKEWGSRSGVDILIQTPFLWKNDKISSGRIRDLIRSGDVQNVPDLLGRCYCHSGTIEPGHQRGSGIGFPTANIRIDHKIIPQDGVYATLSILKMKGDSPKTFRSVTHIGPAPTLNRSERVIETHFIHQKFPDLYGADLEIQYLKRIRGVVKFGSLDELKNQIAADIQSSLGVRL